MPPKPQTHKKAASRHPHLCLAFSITRMTIASHTQVMLAAITANGVPGTSRIMIITRKVLI